MVVEENTTTTKNTTQRPNRRWFRYSLRTFLLVITAHCVWLGLNVEAAHKQHEAVASLRGMCKGVTIKYDYETELSLIPPLKTPLKAPEPHWLAKCFGLDLFHDVTVVCLQPGLWPNSPADVRAIFPVLAELPRLRYLNIIGGTFHDDDFRYLARNRDLEILFLNQNNISGEGLKHLCELKKLRQLVLVSNPITDQGMEATANLPSLQELQIGIGHGGPRADAELPKITDQCVDSLAKVTNLKHVHIEETDVSADAISRLNRALPNCWVYYDNYAAERWTKWEHVINAPPGAAARASGGDKLPGSK